MTKKTNKKLPPASDWQARDINDWNTTTFTHYLQDKHRELFGIEYAPMRSWRMEQGQLGRLIGTRTKEGTHSKAIVKAFIDEAFRTYRPTPQYPGTNFGFIYAYRRNILQRLEAEQVTKQRRKETPNAKPLSDSEIDKLSDWF